MFYLFTFFLTFLISVGLTLLIRRLALKAKIVDRPESIPARKIHSRPIPLLGGLAPFLALAIVLTGLYFSGRIPGSSLLTKHLIGIIIGGGILMLGGFLDDKYHLKPYQQIIWPILAILVIIVSGIGIQYVNNPFGPGFWHLDKIKIEVLQIGGMPYYFTLLADFFTFFWLLGIMYTSKLLDGLDGLVAGITVIGALIIFFLTSGWQMNLPGIAVLSLVLAASFLGILVLNFHPARIFLGEGGSLFAGFMLGVLAITGGGKIATTLLVVGIPALDVGWTIVRRLSRGKNPFLADRGHLHFRLLDVGFSHRRAVVFLWLLALIFGSASLLFKTKGKLIALITLGILMVVLAISLVLKSKTPKKLTPNP